MAEVEFRDGKREVPDHLAAMMKGIDTYRLTFDEAVAAANRRMEANHVDRAFDAVRKAHFRAWGGGG